MTFRKPLIFNASSGSRPKSWVSSLASLPAPVKMPKIRQWAEAAKTAEVCLVVGTSALVHPAASLPLLTKESGGVVVEVNTEPTPLTEVAELSLRGPAGQILPRLLTVEP